MMNLFDYRQMSRKQLIWEFDKICNERGYVGQQRWGFRTSKMSKEKLAELVYELTYKLRGPSVAPKVPDLEKEGRELLRSIEMMRRDEKAVKNTTFIDEKQEFLRYKRASAETLAKFALAICASPVDQEGVRQAVLEFARLESYSDLGDAEAALTVKFMDWQKT